MILLDVTMEEPIGAISAVTKKLQMTKDNGRIFWSNTGDVHANTKDFLGIPRK